MLPIDKQAFGKVLNGLAAIKGKELTQEAVILWWNSMQSWSIEDFKAAASHLVGSCQFMPTPYDFEQLRKAGEMTSGEAWRVVLAGAELDPNSREYRAAQIVGGQYAIRHANVERELPFIAKRFREAYEELSDVDAVRVALPSIAANRSIPDLSGALKRMPSNQRTLK